MDINQEYSFKELYDVVLKTNDNIYLEGRKIKPHETVAAFDKIQLMNFKEVNSYITAHGGFDDRDRVVWESIKEVKLDFTQGCFSNTQLALMTNNRLLKLEEETPFYFNKREVIETNHSGELELSSLPYQYLFIYDYETGLEVPNTEYTIISEKVLGSLQPYKEYLCDYSSEYKGGGSVIRFGSILTSGFLTFQGKTRVKDDITGIVRTAVLTIPKLKVMSDLSMRLGKDAIPHVGHLSGVALPVGQKGSETIMEMTFLNDDIDSDL